MALEYTVTLVVQDPLERGPNSVEQAIAGFEGFLEEQDLYVQEVEVES